MKKAAEGLVLILVDRTNRGPSALAEKYAVKGLPTVVYCDPEGNEVGRMSDRSSAAIAKQFQDLTEKHTKRLPWRESIEEALEEAKESEKPVLAYFTDGEEASKSADEVFLDKSLEADLKGFVLVRHEIHKKDCETCEAYRARKGPLLFVLDPTVEDPAKKPLAKITSVKKAKDLQKALESTAKKFAAALEKAEADGTEDAEEEAVPEEMTK